MASVLDFDRGMHGPVREMGELGGVGFTQPEGYFAVGGEAIQGPAKEIAVVAQGPGGYDVKRPG